MLTVEKEIEVLVTVKVHTGVLATWVIVSRWKSSLKILIQSILGPLNYT